MPWAKHWEVRTHIKHFYENTDDYRYGAECRYVILDYLLLRCNPRLRTYVGIPTIMNDTGITSKAAVAGAIKWLFDHGAIYNVPPQYRVGKEAELTKQKYVFQMTGTVLLSGKWVRYLLFSPDDLEMMMEEWQRVGCEIPISAEEYLAQWDGSPNELSNSSPNEPSPNEPEVLTDIALSSKNTSSSDEPPSNKEDAYRANMLGKVTPQTSTNTGDEGKAVDYSPLATFVLVKYVLAELKQDSLVIKKNLGEWLTQKQIVKDGPNKITYADPVTLFNTDETFKDFVRERVAQFVNMPNSTAENTLLNLCRFSHHNGEPDASGKRRLKSYHFWKAQFTTTAHRDTTPLPEVVASPFAGWKEEDLFGLDD